ncbi:restriction endonuclease subunit S [Brevibacterium sp. S111]|uniref:restriction endonuclease subunit S n=1 Tax=Brevibacterium sp. S111 TaxID=2483795 RepID=UPI001080213A|nr:restriction endonuclease subunit S [Brevibacterium sp. S111]TGD12081.1 restriction endonuclease subunit S [Brevibacterium sp. S111]
MTSSFEIIETTWGELVSVKQGRYVSKDRLFSVRSAENPTPTVGANGILGFVGNASYSQRVPLVTCRGSNCGLIQYPNEPVWVNNNAMALNAGSQQDNDFIYYLALNTRFDDVTSGSAQPQITAGPLKSKTVKVPERKHWRAIAATLGALDDKIDSNRRQRALFRTLGKARYESAILSESRTVPLSDVTVSIARGVAPKYTDDDPTAPYVVNQRCIRDGWVSLQLARRMSDRKVKVEKRASGGDILVNSTGTGTLGRVARWHAGDVFVDGHVSVVKPDPTCVPPTTLAYSLLNRESDIEELATGSTGQTELSAARLAELLVRLPTCQSALALESDLIAIENRCHQLAAEIQRLAALRDTLLPELLSGRIRVPAEGFTP